MLASKDLGYLGEACKKKKKEDEGERRTIDLLSLSPPEKDSLADIHPPRIHGPV